MNSASLDVPAIFRKSFSSSWWTILFKYLIMNRGTAFFNAGFLEYKIFSTSSCRISFVLGGLGHIGKPFLEDHDVKISKIRFR